MAEIGAEWFIKMVVLYEHWHINYHSVRVPSLDRVVYLLNSAYSLGLTNTRET